VSLWLHLHNSYYLLPSLTKKIFAPNQNIKNLGKGFIFEERSR
jgi:hypothetical protein